MHSASVPDRTRVDEDRHADPRVAATITLLGVVMAAALHVVADRHPAANSPQTAAVESTAVAPTPVKIIGAAPRGESCADQVWPYIEPRCLTRAPDARPATPATGQAKVDVARTTTGAAPTERAAPAERAAPVPAAASNEQHAHQRVATSYLPVPQAARRETTGLAAPPGAVPLRRFDSDTSTALADDDGWNERSAESARSTEARRHGGRRWHRTRQYQRSFFGIPF